MQLPSLLKKIQIGLANSVDSIVPQWLHPNIITALGAGLNLVLFGLYSFKAMDTEVFLWLLLSTQLFDILDGAIARKRNLTSRIGRLLDTGVDMISGIIVCTIFVFMGGMIQWVWVVLLACLYAIRYILVLKSTDTEWGGYKNALTVGFLCAWYSFFDFTLVVQLVAIFNIFSIIRSVKNTHKQESQS